MTEEARRKAYLQALNIPAWQLRSAPVVEPGGPQETAAEANQSVEGADSAADRPPVATLDWSALRERVMQCQACPLHATRTQGVFGVGNTQAEWMLIGEAPGAEEDRQGEPFVGRAGQLLDAMLAAAGTDRQKVYIANIIKSRPPDNRDPQPGEIAACLPYLRRQIELISPRVIMLVGRVAAQTLLESTAAVGRLRGQVHRLPGFAIPAVVTYHPAYLLRSPLEKRKVWDDLRLLRRTLESTS
ncbi:uracil-DNA glycosylase [Natronospira bacteriovora]|uniref:Type-4 uracil-DNA glycosylase n=1 Tax=Natronospira bacteriovora TaxID=3069753 RepID=A0ABU0W8X4_9GAMM|nr:uracil-DNA glycosylase [Natronospira sp. AB-CW4]MDQ2069435.1 uracil-DNA glycosylase [Natronospira sp. AB-CW4]